MKATFRWIAVILSGLAATMPAHSQSTLADPQQTAQPAPKKGRSAGGDVGSGTGDIGKGAAKGTGSAAVGAGKGAGDLVTLHPLNAAGDAGKGAAVAGKDVAVGTTKGTGKVVKGVGKGVKKVF